MYKFQIPGVQIVIGNPVFYSHLKYKKNPKKISMNKNYKNSLQTI
jgi:hypothetical protein